jgi:TnpA family transposase
VILRKLSAAGAGNALSRALRAVGRIERTLFTLLMWNTARKSKVPRL